MGANPVWRKLVLLLLLALTVALAGFVLNQEPDHPLGRRNYQQIVAGMTRDDVARILGGPPGPVGEVPEQPGCVQLVEQEGPANASGGLEGKPEVWYSGRGQIVVLFDTWDKTGRVVGKQRYRVVPRQ
jgi:hypothetical protein